jgi:hypothetical protein
MTATHGNRGRRTARLAALQLWAELGVPKSVTLPALVRRLNAMPSSGSGGGGGTRGRPLGRDDLDFAIKILRYIAKEADDPELELPALGIRQLPSQDRRMLPPSALFANDAQWIVDSSSSGGDSVAGAVAAASVLHADVPSVFGPALGIRSVRERILTGTQAAHSVPCPNAREVAAFNLRRYGAPAQRSSSTTTTTTSADGDSKQGGGGGGGGAQNSNCVSFVVDDLLRCLDASPLQATWVHIHADERTYPRERLVHTCVRACVRAFQSTV